MKRLEFLPRLGIVVDFAGREFSLRQAPFLETLVNLRGKKANLRNWLEVAVVQLREIRLPDQDAVKLAGEKLRGPKRRRRR